MRRERKEDDCTFKVVEITIFSWKSMTWFITRVKYPLHTNIRGKERTVANIFRKVEKVKHFDRVNIISILVNPNFDITSVLRIIKLLYIYLRLYKVIDTCLVSYVYWLIYRKYYVTFSNELFLNLTLNLFSIIVFLLKNYIFYKWGNARDYKQEIFMRMEDIYD